MKTNIFKKSFFLLTSCLIACIAWGQTQSFTAAEIKSGTTKGAVTVSTTLNVSNKQMCKEGSSGTKYDAVEGSTTAGNVDENYVEISSTSDITKLVLHATFNSSGDGKKMAFIYWGEKATPAYDNTLSAELVPFTGYAGKCDANYVEVTPPAGARIVRIYRQLKGFNGTGYEKNAKYGEGQTYLIADIDVTAGPAGPSSDATLSGITYNSTAVPGFSADKTAYDVELPVGTTTPPTVAATTNHAKATATVTQPTTLPGTATIDVTAEDGTTKQYTVTFTIASAAPKVTGCTISPSQKGQVTVDNVNMTITGQVTNGTPLTSIVLLFTGNNLTSCTPDPAVGQDFSKGPIQYTFTSESGEKATYTVTITEADKVTITGVTLDKSTLALQIGASATLTATVVPTDADNTNVKWSSSNEAVATVSASGKVTAKADGKATITAQSEGDPTKTATCEVTVTAGPPVPDTKLLVHLPEKYEAKSLAGGYNTPLTNVGGREYEVYYTERTAEGSYPTFSTTLATEGKATGISGSTSTDKNVGTPGDTWFEGTVSANSECKDASDVGEFDFETEKIREHRLGSGKKYQFHIQGYDQFSFWAKDKKLSSSEVWGVKIDGVEQTVTSSESYTVRRFDITTSRHLIEIYPKNMSGSNQCALAGFSLRIAQEPRTKWLKGNDTTQVVLQTAAPKPVYYFTKYNNIEGAETKLEWEGAQATGITLNKYSNNDLGDTLVLGGVANCPTGEYKYNVIAYYNGIETSRASGKFYVKSEIKAETDTIIEAYVGEPIDEIKFKYYALKSSDVTLTWTATAPAGITGSGKDGKYTISGTPTAVGDYPFVIAVAEGNSIQGLIKVKNADYGNDPVLYLYKNNLAYEKDGIYQYLTSQAGGAKNLITRKALENGLRAAEQYAKYKWVLISEDVDADNAEVLALARGEVAIPVLNMKSFSYTPDRLDWGEPDNGSISDNGKSITVQREDHPIFKALNKRKGDKITVLDSLGYKGLMPAAVDYEGSLCLATALTRSMEDYYGDGVQETFLHEVPVSLRKGGKKYICMPIALASSSDHAEKRLTADGKRLVNEVVKYLLSNDQTVGLPTLAITEFSVSGMKATITDNIIELQIDKNAHPNIDLTAIAPKVVLADQSHTSVSPADNETVDFSQSSYRPVIYVVTDYINRKEYEVTIRLYSPQGIDEVYTVGEWVNIYDIYGRKVATTNENIYQMALPHGVYMIVNEKGETMKMLK